MAKQKCWNIQSGPSKFDYMESLFHRKYPGAEVEMRIQEEKGTISEVRKVEISILSRKINRDENSRDPQLWGFFGYMEHASDRPGYSSGRLPFPVVGEYSTSTRTGKVREAAESFYNDFRKMGLL